MTSTCDVQSSASSANPGTSVFQRTQSWGPFMVMYGTGQVAGTVAADTLKIGDITIENQGFGLVLHASSDFLDISCDGLFVRFPTLQSGRFLLPQWLLSAGPAL